ncbi:MAG: GNAT family N-acetyltransferase [Actinomycetes bacterium]
MRHGKAGYGPRCGLPVIEVRRGDAEELPGIRSSWPEASGVVERHLAGQEAGGSTLLVAWSGARAVGYVVVRWTGADTPLARQAFPGAAEVAHLFVRLESRGVGVGSTLLEVADRVAADRGVKQLVLGVGEDNPAAARLYERFGYRRTGIVEVSEYDYLDGRGVDRHAVEWNECLVRDIATGP